MEGSSQRDNKLEDIDGSLTNIHTNMEVSYDAREIIFMVIHGGRTAADRLYSTILLDSSNIVCRLSIHTVC